MSTWPSPPLKVRKEPSVAPWSRGRASSEPLLSFMPTMFGAPLQQLEHQLHRDGIVADGREIVEEQGKVGYAGRHGQVMCQEGILAVAIDEGRNDGRCIGAHVPRVAGQEDRVGRGDGAGVDDDRHTATSRLHDRLGQQLPLVQVEQEPLPSGAARIQAGHGLIDQVVDQPLDCPTIDSTIRIEGCNDGHDDAANVQSHGNASPAVEG